MGRLAALVACLAVAFALFYAGAKSPAPLPANAPASVFSAGRALDDIRHIAPVPHPIGSEANHAVRDYLVGRMTALGLSPQVWRADSVFAPARAPGVVLGGAVEDIVGVLPGKNRNLPALALMAHYDSVPASPGAADDAAGVSSALEIARAIRARGTPERDVMLLITDGEEPGLLGANAFFADHPAAAHVGYILNMEARGSGGRASMFQTGPGNGAVVDLYRHTAKGAQSSSLAVFIYKMLPNDTDLTISLAKGIPGLNFAFIGRQFDYHSPTATLATLDVGAIQSLGDQVLGPAMAMAFADRLPAKTPDAVYGNLALGQMVAYPTWGGWILLALAAALTGWGAYAARQAKAFSWRDLWKGVGASLAVLTAALLAMYLTRLTTGVGFGYIAGRAILARFPVFEVAMLAAAVAAAVLVPPALVRGKGRIIGPIVFILFGLALAAVAGFQAPTATLAATLGLVGAVLAYLLFGRPACLSGIWTGLIVVGLGASLALQIAAPTAAPFIAWPTAAAAALSALTSAGTVRAGVRWGLAAVLIVLALSFVGGNLHAFMQALDQPIAPAIVTWIGAMILWPLAWPREGVSRWAYLPGALALLVALGIALFMRSTSPWTPRHPQSAMPLYVVQVDAGRAWRVTPQDPGGWSRGVLSADGGKIGRRMIAGFGDMPVWAAPARPVAATAPAITVAKGADGTVTVAAPFSERTLRLTLELKADTLVTDTRVGGRPTRFLTQPGKPSIFVWQAAPRGLTLSFKPVGPGALDIAYADWRQGWPADAKPLPKPPPTVMLFDLGGATVVTGRLRRTW